MWAIGRFAIGYRFPISVTRYPHTLRCVDGADAEVGEDVGDDLVALQRVARETWERDLTTMESYIRDYLDQQHQQHYFQQHSARTQLSAGD